MKTEIELRESGWRSKNKRPFWMAMPWLLLVCVSSFASCATERLPNGPDGRPCWVGVLDSQTAMLLRASHPKWEIKTGDLIQTPECAIQESQDLLNSLYRETR